MGDKSDEQLRKMTFTSRGGQSAGDVYNVYAHMDGNHEITDVWSYNLYEEMQKIIHCVHNYQYVAMDTEFPGTVLQPDLDTNDDVYNYTKLKMNCDVLNIIQLGLSFCDENGVHPPRTWQFHFHFSMKHDRFAEDSIQFLQTCGLDFPKHEKDGINIYEFAEMVMMSGIVLSDELTWITFHAGYDYGYLLKLLTDLPLPREEHVFFELLAMYFPRFFDIKYMMRSCDDLQQGGLNKLADELDVKRIGPQHQAGSDSLLTAATFFKLASTFFDDALEEHKYMNVLYGYGKTIKPRTALNPRAIDFEVSSNKAYYR